MTTRKTELDIIFKTFNKVEWKNRNQLPNKRAVYIFVENSIILYVGVTRNIKKRMSRHHITKEWIGKNFFVYWDGDYTFSELSELEEKYIRLLDPLLNKSSQMVSWTKKASHMEEEYEQQQNFVKAYKSNTLTEWFKTQTLFKTSNGIENNLELLKQFYLVFKQEVGE